MTNDYPNDCERLFRSSRIPSTALRVTTFRVTIRNDEIDQKYLKQFSAWELFVRTQTMAGAQMTNDWQRLFRSSRIPSTSFRVTTLTLTIRNDPFVFVQDDNDQ